METVDSKFLCNRYDITKQGLADWCRRVPAIRVGHNQYDLTECDLFVINKLKKELQTAKDKQEDGRLYLAQCRRTEAEANIKELEFNTKNGLMMPAKDAIEVIEVSFTTVRDKLLGMPYRMALELSGMTEPTEISARLDEVIRETLEDLSHDFQREDDDTIEDIKEDI